MRFFFYGTLLDRDVTAIVLGRRLPPQAYLAASLPGHARRRAKGATYPVVTSDPCEEVEGAIVGGLSRRDVARLAGYEGPGYRIAPLRVKVAGILTTVSVFEPIQARLQPSNDPWDLRLWQRRHKRPFVGWLRKALNERLACSTT
jgi:Gamma-glutamyl cyclotransferase, AIG2-like